MTGVDPENRADAEQAFFRAMADLLPPNAWLGDAAAINQSTIDPVWG